MPLEPWSGAVRKAPTQGIQMKGKNVNFLLPHVLVMLTANRFGLLSAKELNVAVN
jgi:hypothetical protein